VWGLALNFLKFLQKFELAFVGYVKRNNKKWRLLLDFLDP